MLDSGFYLGFCFGFCLGFNLGFYLGFLYLGLWQQNLQLSSEHWSPITWLAPRRILCFNFYEKQQENNFFLLWYFSIVKVWVLLFNLDMSHAADDTSSDLTRFKLKIAFLSIVILHEDPSTVPHEAHEVTSTCTSMEKLREVAEKYFDSVRRDVTIAGVSTQAGLAELRNGYSKACRLDHLG